MLKELKEIKVKVNALTIFAMERIKGEMADSQPNIDLVDYWTKTFADGTNLTADLQRLIEYYKKYSEDLKTGMDIKP